MNNSRHCYSSPSGFSFYKLLIVCGFLVWVPFAAQTQQAQDQEAADDSAEQPQAETSDDARVRRLSDSLATDPNQEWVPSLEVGSQDRSIARKLDMARQALQAGDLVEPQPGSALSFFQEVLAIDANNTEAQQGVTQIANQLLQQAQSALSQNRGGETTRLLALVRGIRPDLPRLAVLERNLATTSRITTLLSTAENQLAQNKLDSPSGDNAIESYQLILTIQADHPQAVQGLAQIESGFLEQAQTALSAQRFSDAATLIDRAESVQGGSEQVTALQETLQQTQTATWATLKSDIQTALSGNNIGLAQQALDGLRLADYSGDDLEELEMQIQKTAILLRFQPGSRFNDTMRSGSESPQMVVIPAGEFAMGSSAQEAGRRDNEGPQQQIRFELPFAMALTEITVAQFRAFVEATGYVTEAERQDESTIFNLRTGAMTKRDGISWRQDYRGANAEADSPVVHISWDDAAAYVDWLNDQTGENYRLPTEAEFEYAQRAGTDSRFWWGDGTPDDQVENLTGERDEVTGGWEWSDPFEDYRDGNWGPAPVASYRTNAFGLYDTGGNAMEWTADCYRDSLSNQPADGAAVDQPDCQRRVIKGGAWALPPDRVRSAQRSPGGVRTRSCLIGFRVVRDLT